MWLHPKQRTVVFRRQEIEKSIGALPNILDTVL
jgi:hypothetical protein